jgi:hypothetical protein
LSAQTGANTAMTALSELVLANFSAVFRLMKPKLPPLCRHMVVAGGHQYVADLLVTGGKVTLPPPDCGSWTPLK